VVVKWDIAPAAWSKAVIDAGRHELAGMTVKVVELGAS
jgi:hypothetical protein